MVQSRSAVQSRAWTHPQRRPTRAYTTVAMVLRGTFRVLPSARPIVTPFVGSSSMTVPCSRPPPLSMTTSTSAAIARWVMSMTATANGALFRALGTYAWENVILVSSVVAHT